MGRRSNTAERRAQIVEGLLTVLQDEGYERASVAEVARAAGLKSSGLVHYHFGSKAEILGELMATLQARLDDANGTDIAGFIDAHLALGPDADPRAVTAAVVIAGEAMVDAEVRRRFETALHRSQDELVARIRARRQLPFPTCRRIAASVLAAIQGAWLLGRTAPRVMPAGDAARTVRDLALALVDGASMELELPPVLVHAAGLDDDVLSDLLTRHREPHRRYHDVEHLHELAEWFVRLEWDQPKQIAQAMLLHDAVYEPLAKDNEERSAQLALAAGCSPRVAELIRWTARHGEALEVDADSGHFLDADMAILAARPARFDRYMDEVHAEFTAFVPAALYTAGRRRFLQGLLERPVFLTRTFSESLEGRARSNLERSL
ncbi:MAG: TetR family transcriptional regulator [Proteobacteria bacterium]|nr:TetR family transcriptional regulator [Pseudomonadota bacterium]MCP4921759.1 TetR family transcriptional regulator [Pseudomonadota bacterium]